MASTASYSPLGHDSDTTAIGRYTQAGLLMLNSKRGRWVLGVALVNIILLVVVFQAPSEYKQTLSSYQSSLTSFYPLSWNPIGPRPENPSIYAYQSPLLVSETAQQIESGNATVPPGLHKSNPSFHLIIPSARGDVEFCQFALSSMVLNYPPPTIIQYDMNYPQGKAYDQERDKLEGVSDFLESNHVKDDDLVLILEGDKTLLQLPSDVLIKQYQLLVREANARLAKQYPKGVSGDHLNQTIFFSAAKLCSSSSEEDPACAAVPDSPLPPTIYGSQTDLEPSGIRNRPNYLAGHSIIGPVVDLRSLFQTAIARMDLIAQGKNPDWPDRNKLTMESLFASIYGEQEFARSVNSGQSELTSWPEWYAKHNGQAFSSLSLPSIHSKDLKISPSTKYEFSIGLDYFSTLFQQLHLSAADELTFLTYTDTALLKKAAHTANTPALPLALLQSPPPFSKTVPGADRLAQARHPFHIPELSLDADLDLLPDHNTSFAALPLLTNTYLPAIPVAISLPTRADDAANYKSVRAQVYHHLWWSPHSRALLRRYLRTVPQGPLAMHSGSVGGDWSWDMRGGQGGVWTAKGVYKEWGLDICKNLEGDVFGDGKGRFLREREPEKKEGRAEGQRVRKRDLYGVEDGWLGG